MGKPDAPEPPDPAATAAAQQQQNLATAIANARLGNVNQITPTGSLTYTRASLNPRQQGRVDKINARLENKDLTALQRQRLQTNLGTVYGNAGFEMVQDAEGNTQYVPGYTSTQTLTPQAQRIFDTNQRTQQNLANLGKSQSARLGSLLGKNVNVNGLPAAGDAGAIDGGAITRSYNTDFSADRQRVEDALMSRLNPSLERDRESLRTSLINQGIREGSVAFDRAMNRADEASTDARMQAILAGGQEQSRMVGLEAQRAGFENMAQQQAFGQGMARFGAANDARGQALNERFALRNQPINEITALMSGSQVAMPNFRNENMPQMPNVDYAGLVQNNYNQQAQSATQQHASRMAMLGSIFGAGGDISSAYLMR